MATGQGMPPTTRSWKRTDSPLEVLEDAGPGNTDFSLEADFGPLGLRNVRK